MEKENNLFEEYYKSARDLIFERFSSPLIFTFVVSWLVSNYKIVMVILTDQTEDFTLDYKFWLINEHLNWFNGFIYPLIAACFYTFGYPYLDKIISEFTLKRKLEKRNAIHAIEKTQLKTAEEVDAIHRRHFKIESELRNEIDNARIAEAQLRAKIDELESHTQNIAVVQKNTSETAAPPPSTEVLHRLTDDEVLVIVTLGKLLDMGADKLDEQEIKRLTNLVSSKIKLALNNLRANHYIGRYSLKYSLEQKGLELYNSLNLKEPKNLK